MNIAATVKAGAPMPVREPRLGFLGLGWIGKSRLEVIRRERIGKIAAIADSNSEAVRSAAEIAPEAEICMSIKDMARCGLDAMIIATPSALHAEQAIEALECGMPVFCQKPLGTSAAETRSIVRTARNMDLLLGVDLSYRHLPGMQEIKRRAAGGDIGTIFAVDLVFHNAYGPDKPWYYDPACAGGGCIMDLGIHLVDLMMWVLDFPKWEAVSGRLLSKGRPLARRGDGVEDYAVARIDIEKGLTATLACSWNLPAGGDAEIRAAFFGSGGALCLSNRRGSFFEFRAERFQKTGRETIIDDAMASWWGLSAVEWVHRLKSDRRYDPELDHMVEVAEILDALYENGGRIPGPQIR